MKTLLITTLFAALISFAPPSSAGQATQQLGLCLTDSLSGKERKKLAEWIFFAIAAHPEIKEFSKVTSENQVNTDKYVGKLISRLLGENCKAETTLAMKEDGPMAMEQAFSLVGQVAMQEIMTNQTVMKTIMGYSNYIDSSVFSDIE